jgi:hypothetical protein
MRNRRSLLSAVLCVLAVAALSACTDVAQPTAEDAPLLEVLPPVPPNPHRPLIPLPTLPIVGQRIVVDDDFESYPVNSNLHGQGGWVSYEISGGPGTGFFARASAPIAGSQSGSLELRPIQSPDRLYSQVRMHKHFDNPILGSPSADHRYLKHSYCSAVVRIPSTWANPEVRKNTLSTSVALFCAKALIQLIFDEFGDLRVRVGGAMQTGPDIVPFDVPVLLEAVFDGQAGHVRYFINGALQHEIPMSSEGHAVGEGLVSVAAQMIRSSSYPVPMPPPDQYDVLVDDIHQTLYY